MKTITTQALKEIIDSNTEESIIIDVRTKEEHKHNRIPDVLNIPLDEIEHHIDTLKQYKTVYIHCHSGNRSSQACDKLSSIGIEHVVNVEGGISNWENSGFPTIKTGKNVIPITRQVFIVAGFLILAGSMLSFINQGFLYLTAAIGAGLLYAGLSGHCGMVFILNKMPWNKTN